jgi:hypothetical protein
MSLVTSHHSESVMSRLTLGFHGLLRRTWQLLYSQSKGKYAVQGGALSQDASTLLTLPDSELYTKRMGARGMKASAWLRKVETLRDLSICLGVVTPIEHMLRFFFHEQAHRLHLSQLVTDLPVVNMANPTSSVAVLTVERLFSIALETAGEATVLTPYVSLLGLLDGRNLSSWGQPQYTLLHFRTQLMN